jgi:hypothetical protein
VDAQVGLATGIPYLLNRRVRWGSLSKGETRFEYRGERGGWLVDSSWLALRKLTPFDEQSEKGRDETLGRDEV